MFATPATVRSSIVDLGLEPEAGPDPEPHLVLASGQPEVLPPAESGIGVEEPGLQRSGERLDVQERAGREARLVARGEAVDPQRPEVERGADGHHAELPHDREPQPHGPDRLPVLAHIGQVPAAGPGLAAQAHDPAEVAAQLAAELGPLRTDEEAGPGGPLEVVHPGGRPWTPAQCAAAFSTAALELGGVELTDVGGDTIVNRDRTGWLGRSLGWWRGFQRLHPPLDLLHGIAGHDDRAIHLVVDRKRVPHERRLQPGVTIRHLAQDLLPQETVRIVARVDVVDPRLGPLLPRVERVVERLVPVDSRIGRLHALCGLALRCLRTVLRHRSVRNEETEGHHEQVLEHVIAFTDLLAGTQGLFSGFDSIQNEMYASNPRFCASKKTTQFSIKNAFCQYKKHQNGAFYLLQSAKNAHKLSTASPVLRDYCSGGVTIVRSEPDN